MKNRYPGPTVKQGYGFHLNEAQVEWLKAMGPLKENEWLAKQMGISTTTLHRFMRKYGITKSEAGMKQITRRCIKKIKRTCERNGYYASLKGRRPCEACLEATRKKRASGWHPFVGMSEKQKTEMKIKRSAERLKLWEKERWRMSMGLPRKTRLILPQVSYSRIQLQRRWNAIKRYGYILGDTREEFCERLVIYYDEETKRSKLFEKNSIKCGFQFRRLEL